MKLFKNNVGRPSNKIVWLVFVKRAPLAYGNITLTLKPGAVSDTSKNKNVSVITSKIKVSLL